jgi:sirohydrochlorin cobaltochelatase
MAVFVLKDWEIIMNKKIIIVVSFGTSYSDTRKKSIENFEDKIERDFKGFDVCRAFTSGTIIDKLRSENINIFNVKEALNFALNSGYDECYVQPTHVIAGIEYEKLCDDCKFYIEKFKKISVGKPLIASTEDCCKIADMLSSKIKYNAGEAVVLMGHGTKHIMNIVYPALAYIFEQKKYSNFFVGTVEAYPGIDEVIEIVKERGFQKVLLTPFMFVAGDHARNDMAGEGPDSWKNKFENVGISARTLIKGLGEYEEITDIYVEHMKKYLGI